MRIINCPICKIDNTKKIWQGKSKLFKHDRIFSLVQCLQCGLVYLNPQPEGKEINHLYSSNYFKENSGFSSGFLYRILSGVKRKIIKSEKPEKTYDTKHILDVGCGGGKWMESQKELHPNWEIWGLDVSPVACKKAIKRGFSVFCCNIEGANLPDSFFDLIHMSHTLEHLPNPVKSLIFLKKSLKKEGIIIIDLPNVNSFSAQLFKEYWYGYQIPLHFFHFSEKTLERALQKARLCIKSTYFGNDPSRFLKSLDLFLFGKVKQINPLFWHLLRPFGAIAGKLKKSSGFTAKASRII